MRLAVDAAMATPRAGGVGNYAMRIIAALASRDDLDIVALVPEYAVGYVELPPRMDRFRVEVLPESEELTALAQQENATDRIRAIGRCPSDLFPHLYRTAAFLVYPSLFEGFGLPPLEAMACGTAVAATSAGAVPEVLQDNAVYFEPRDVDSIATALGRLAREVSLRESLAQQGSAHAARFSWERTAEQTVRAIRQGAAV
jgi:glycosyltransferase involved in cell wall biosynthesis